MFHLYRDVSVPLLCNTPLFMRFYQHQKNLALLLSREAENQIDTTQGGISDQCFFSMKISLSYHAVHTIYCLRSRLLQYSLSHTS